MANRIAGSVVIVDSAMGNALILNSANSPMQILKMKVNSIAFWSSDTTGRCIITEIDTTNCIASFSWFANGTGGGIQAATQTTSFGNSQPFENLKIPTLTAGTAWIYLC